jgi:potassium/chloride transporter 8
MGVFNMQRGANRTPIAALLVMTAFSLVFILAADLNMLALLSTIPFLITYGVINWAYVSLAMTYDIQAHREMK